MLRKCMPVFQMRKNNMSIIRLDPKYENSNKDIEFLKTGWDNESIESIQWLWRLIESKEFNGFLLGECVDI